MIKKLPHWVLSSPNPSFYETEGGTVLEQTAIMYKKVNEVIEGYNGMIDGINKVNEDFIEEATKRQEEFEVKINQMIYDFTKLVETELKDQDVKVDNATEYFYNNLEENINKEIYNLFETGEFKLEFTYDPETESLNYIGVITNEDGE